MQRIITFIFYLLLSQLSIAQSLRVEKLLCNDHADPVAVATQAPRFSWQLVSGERDVMQQSYRILVSDNLSDIKSDKGNLWDSKNVNNSASLNIKYAGRGLQSNKEYYWKVKVADNKNKSSVWSGVNHFRIGLLTQKDWRGAQWIAYNQMSDSSRILPGDVHEKGKPYGTVNDTLPLFRKSFAIHKKIKEAVLYISGLGHFDAYLNGKKIGDHFLDAGWVNYQKSALYVAFDVTKQIDKDKNVLGVMLGNGFYYIPQVKHRYKKLTVQYGYPKMICRLAVEYTDGSSDNIISDDTWKTSASPITFSGIYGGEDYDAKKEQKSWDLNSFNDEHWKEATIVKGPPDLHLQQEEPLKIMEQFKPVNSFRVKDGWVYDVGQNASGIPQITVQGSIGDTVTIIPAELLKKDSSANQSATGSPYLLHYIMGSDKTITWQPQFTYYGFRYLELKGAVPEGQPNPDRLPVLKEVIGLHTRNSADSAGSFSCSSELFNRIYNLINWAVKSNMASVFTDCPHREKLGWLEEVHLMGSSMRYAWQVKTLLEKSVSDMQDAQTTSGLVPEIAPEFTVFTYGGDMFRDSPEWGSSSIIVPWYIYRWYGDESVLRRSYDMMKRYVEYLSGKAKDNILYQGLGDWYDIGKNPPGVSQLTPQGLTGTAIYYYDLTILQQVAKLLHDETEAMLYKQMAASVKQSFNQKFFNKDSAQYGSGSQTADAMALYMQLVPEEYRQKVFDNLVNDIIKRNYALTAGDIGYRYVLKVLQDFGRSDIIYQMNNRSDVPGYGYQLAKGATSLTESWQALSSVSNNHLMLGHFMEWLYEGLAGIRQAENSIAFKHIIIAPEMVGDIAWAKADYRSPYGLVISSWKKENDKISLDIQIPPDTDADVYLPVKGNCFLTESGKKINYQIEQNKALVHVGSGIYHFVVHNL